MAYARHIPTMYEVLTYSIETPVRKTYPLLA